MCQQTYPTEYNTEKEAEEAAAKLACEKLNLNSQSFSTPTLPGTSALAPPTSSDISADVMIDRVLDIVANRTNGVWSTRVETEYIQKFGQSLPLHWTERIETYQTRDRVKKKIHIERPIQDRCIVMPFIDQVKDEKQKPKSVASW